MTAEEFRRSNLTSEIKQQIIVYEHLIDGLESIKPHILAFDGKVINKRLSMAIEPDLPHDLLVTINTSVIKVEDWKHKNYKRTNGYGTVSDRIREVVIVYKDNNRLDASAVCHIVDCRIAGLRNDILSCQKDLNSFQSEHDDWNKIVEMVEDYKSKHSYRIKGYIDMKR